MNRITLKNAVLLKDMSIKSKRKNMTVSLFVINILIGLGFLFFILCSNISLANFDPIDVQAFTWVFDGFIIVECAVICFVIPTETGPAISNERERQTLDVLLTTNLSNFDIILGKYLSAVIYMLIIIASLLPFLAVILVYGGVTFIQLITVLFSVIATAMYLSTFGIYFSSIVRKSSRAAAVNFAVIFLLVLGSMFFCLVVKLIHELSGGIVYNGGAMRQETLFTNGDWTLFLLYLNPASTVFDILDKQVGFNLSTSYHGMASVFSIVSDLNPSSFFIKHWSLVGYILQFALGCLLLKGAASSLNNVKRRKRGK